MMSARFLQFRNLEDLKIIENRSEGVVDVNTGQ